MQFIITTLLSAAVIALVSEIVWHSNITREEFL
jgi:hypothetical protein